MLIEHPALNGLATYFARYQSMLKAVAEQGERFHASAQESYAAKVFEKLAELELDLSNLAIASHFIRALSPADRPEIYRYHEENFMLRLAAIVEKAQRLVGMALLLKAEKCEGAAGTVFVIRAVKDNYPEIALSLERLAALAAKQQKLRHQSPYLNLSLAIAAEWESDYLSQQANLLDELADKATRALNALLLAMSAVFALL
ncbi:hypothetical protein R6242_18645 [Iodobacter sp. CM08]|uniref:hypothetical protein n=1 Tax=Iodobacter sp. CM08 TaxID=3085902 RepID=UPI002980C946|nr:hypothetical protein [Iodobacter sp. CM08]MDW5418588.1 hypothetical protein [Iodobacter sp. CM08]